MEMMLISRVILIEINICTYKYLIITSNLQYIFNSVIFCNINSRVFSSKELQLSIVNNNNINHKLQSTLFLIISRETGVSYY